MKLLIVVLCLAAGFWANATVKHKVLGSGPAPNQPTPNTACVYCLKVEIVAKNAKFQIQAAPTPATFAVQVNRPCLVNKEVLFGGTQIPPLTKKDFIHEMALPDTIKAYKEALKPSGQAALEKLKLSKEDVEAALAVLTKYDSLKEAKEIQLAVNAMIKTELGYAVKTPEILMSSPAKGIPEKQLVILATARQDNKNFDIKMIFGDANPSVIYEDLTGIGCSESSKYIPNDEPYQVYAVKQG